MHSKVQGQRRREIGPNIMINCIFTNLSMKHLKGQLYEGSLPTHVSFLQIFCILSSMSKSFHTVL